MNSTYPLLTTLIQSAPSDLQDVYEKVIDGKRILPQECVLLFEKGDLAIMVCWPE
jgi:hypothetical protein